MMKSERLSAVSRQLTPDRLRCEAMGFTLEASEVLWADDALVLRGHMRCVCGRCESFNFRFEIDPAALDPARLLREHGAFGVEHLAHDGYTPPEIDAIVTQGHAHDLAHR